MCKKIFPTHDDKEADNRVHFFAIIHIILVLGRLKTSPPSARVAAMSAMQPETSLKHLECFFLKIP